MEIQEELQKDFESQNVQIILFPEQIVRKFKSLKQFCKFIQDESDFWSTCTGNGSASSIYSHFNSALNNLNSAINNYNSNNAHNSINQLNTAINSAQRNGFPAIFSSTAYACFIKERHQEHYYQGSAAIDFLCGNNLGAVNDINYFKGLLYAFNWKDSEIACTKFEESQDSSFADLRKQYSEAMDSLHTEYLTKNREVNEVYSSFTGEIESWKSSTQSTTEIFLGEKQNKFKELEEIYQEKLRLKAPADYWNELHTEYENKGKAWRKWSIGTATVIILLLLSILYKMPDSLNVNLKSFSLENLRGTLILTIIISIGIYLLRLFVKLSTSAYHLSRDAKERYQLTHVYLALLNEKGITDAERNIVLQSLFSRADTGLLKGDSSPTLPDGMVQQIMKLIK